ncbi:MAG: septal ring lytic transglycosylase RlpA family protein [Proteobacteria bacterium]|nr:septal ring lytic transglycosylase RlpA family protein [Pseudomonadota bacterium]
MRQACVHRCVRNRVPSCVRPRLRQAVPSLASALLCLALANCSSSDKLTRKVDPKYGVSASPRVVEPGQPVPKGGGTYRVGKPYAVGGKMYFPDDGTGYRVEGIASWYGGEFHGRLTANGEVFDMHSLSAAHPTLPMPSYVRVTNLANRRSLIVRVNDRGPFHNDRVIDLSTRAAHLLAFHGNGVARVRVEYVGRAPLEGSDDRQLLATLRQGQPAPAPFAVASTRPFAPGLALAGPLRGEVPVPPGRPYSLNEPQAVSDDAGRRDIAAAVRARLRETARFDHPPARAAHVDVARVEPARGEFGHGGGVAAYAPLAGESSSRSGAAAALISGRGLY